MTEPIYAQRYHTRKHLPPGRAAAAYQGQDAQGRPVVVTIVRPFDPDTFLRTVGIVSSVRHLDLAPVVDAGREGADCFVVQEDPGGTDALALAGAGPLPVANAALMAASAAAGLAALHARGVVHGGVDPVTLVRAADGSTKLTGAGFAEAYPPPDLRPGTPPGIARYLSPEEVTGRAPSPASDVYRLGLVAYLLLTGHHAFDGVDAAIVAQEQLDGVVRPPQLLNPEVPPALAQIVMRALDKDPGARGTAAQFQADIERVLRSAQVEEVAVERRPSRAWLWILLVVIAALIALGAVWALTRDKGGDVKVPDVLGMTQKKAGATLTDAGLKTGKVTRVQSSEPEGTVVAQDPAAGEQGGRRLRRRPRGRRGSRADGDPGRGAGRGGQLAGQRAGAARRCRVPGGRDAGGQRFGARRQCGVAGAAGRSDRLAGQHREHRRLDGSAADVHADAVHIGQPVRRQPL